ncbi:ribonuclease T [Erythrobacter sp. SG61-1L]|uniref:ribonuclease T2 n=1 Tax=Erythrobacter sp. SG61-1L TaxID=1603897 RepID=UPI0006C91D6D|nr:ribonuclease T2 [Erythrobacter sp. SG61-1L]KPL69136.1 ribonuclease T [Erythrobacter sp. SG61-1L]
MPVRETRLASLVAAALLAILPTAAHAQAFQCYVPNTAPVIPKPVPDGPTRQSAATHYTLALSWSPEYCRTRKAKAADRFQCGGKNGRFGLVLHGLWPEGKGGEWPQWCPTTRQVTPQIARQNLCMTPSAALLAHEWAKHGACMTKRPEAYFKAARILWNSLTLPDLDRLSRQKGLNAGAIRQAMADAFPAFTPAMVGVRLNKGGWLEEIRLCYGRNFRPTRCTRAQYGPADGTPAKIWRGL